MRNLFFATLSLFLVAGMNPAQAQRPLKEAARGVGRLQQWYVPSTGLYAQPSGWWNAANAMTMLVNYARISGDRRPLGAVENTFGHASEAAHTTDFLNEFNDDEGWWALAWIDAYDLTGKAEYLAMAENIFHDLEGQWETETCGGGIWWSKKTRYKNAIANELFLSVAASLANRVSDPVRREHYHEWAQREWSWFDHSGMMNAQGLVNDGLDSKNPSACVNNGRTTWSYNQGVILGGLVELAKADNNSQLLDRADAIASATMEHLTVAGGVLNDRTVHGNDAPQFKGIFLRNLMALQQAAPHASYKSFARANARSIIKHDTGAGHTYGGLWQGPFDSADAIRQTSALDALIAAAAMR